MADTFTLAQFAQMFDNQPLKKAVINVFRKESLMENFSIANHQQLSLELFRAVTNPGGQTRSIGEAFADMELAEIEPVRETPSFLGGKIDIPKEYVDAKNQMIDQRAFQSEAAVRAMAYYFNNMLINGTGGKDMVGLWYRLRKDLDSAQTILGGGLEVDAGATGLAANQVTLIDKITEAIDACDGHTADLMICNRTAYRRIVAAIRDAGMFATVKDSYDRTIVTFGVNGPKILDAGYKEDQTTAIIGNTEADDGSALTGGDATSIYFAKTGGEQHLNLWQFNNLDVVDKGLIEAHTHYRTIVDWGVGLYFVNPRSLSRLVGIVVA